MTQPTTTMAAALAEAGVIKTLPSQREMIWRVVKEATPKGGATAREVSRRLSSIPPASISSMLSDMERRGMVYSRGTKGYGPSGKAKQYLTDEERYDLLPAPKYPAPPAAPAKSRKAGNVPSSAPPPTLPADPAADPVALVQQIMEYMTLAQLRELHRKLERMFNDKR